MSARDQLRRGVAGTLVLLAGPGDASWVVYNYLRRRFDDVVMVLEEGQSRIRLTSRRARRVGWVDVFGQVAFVLLVMPVLRWRARKRIREILDSNELDPHAPGEPAEVHRVCTVNDPQVRALVDDLDPRVVVVHGTRIISSSTIAGIGRPMLNLHAGITPQYRGVHGGYWALAERRPELAGSTVHLIDAGIDTGEVLAQRTFRPTKDDSIATYPYLQLAVGLPMLTQAIEDLSANRAGEPRTTASDATASDATAVLQSRLRWHPTIWGYWWRRLTRRVR